MATKKTADPYPLVIETFHELGAYEQRQLTQDSPSCGNGQVSVHRYRITVERIEETPEVLFERLQKLWRESGNHHHMGPLRSAAKSLGFDLKSEDFGKDRKR